MRRRDSLSGAGGAGARGGRRCGWRQSGFVLWRWALVLLPVLFVLIYGVWFYRMPSDFFRHAPGASIIMKGMLSSESARLQAAGMKYLGVGRMHVDPQYFDALLQICNRLGRDESADLFPELIGCLDYLPSSDPRRHELARRMLGKVWPIIKKYPDEPQFIFWAAVLIREGGERADVEALENAFRAALSKTSVRSTLPMEVALRCLLEMKPAMAPYDRLVELGLAPSHPERITELPIKVEDGLYLGIIAYLRTLYESAAEETAQRKAQRLKVARDTRLGDFFFHLDRQSAQDGTGGLINNLDWLSAPQRARYLQLATGWLLAVSENLITSEFSWHTVGHLDDANMSEGGRTLGLVKLLDRRGLRDQSYYQALEALLHSKWKDRPNPSYNPDDPRRDNNYKTFGEVFQAILNDRAKDAAETGAFRAAARDWEKALGLEGLMIGQE